jgi:FAD/FMN-containing dehydrogenase
VSSTDVSSSELFGAPGSSPRTLDRYVARVGRVEAIWFPFTTEPWLKVWSLSPQKPLTSRPVQAPYNYVFADAVQQPVSDAVRTILSGHPEAAPLLGAASLAVSQAGLVATATTDIWGWAKNLLLYVKPSTIRFTANGYAVITNRSSLQRVVHDFAQFYGTRLEANRESDRYPINGPVEIRVTGLDQPGDVDHLAPQSPQLSALRPRPDHPEWDIAVWIDVLTLPGTPTANQFYRELEQWMFSHYSGWATVRAEWSKGWAYTDSGAWSDPTVLHQAIPASLRDGQAPGDGWDAAMASLDRYDPFRVFSNAFLNALSQ